MRKWTKPKPIDRHFFCADCEAGFTVPGEQAKKQLKATGKVKCPKCGKNTAAMGLKCTKCETVFAKADTKGKRWPDTLTDKCPKCGHSAMREQILNIIRIQKKTQTFDRKRLPPVFLEVLEEAEAESGK